MASVVAAPWIAWWIWNDLAPGTGVSPQVAQVVTLAAALLVYPAWSLWRRKVPDRLRVGAEVVELRARGRTLNWPTELVTAVRLQGDRLQVEASHAKCLLGGFGASELAEVQAALGLDGTDPPPLAAPPGGIPLGESVWTGVKLGVLGLDGPADERTQASPPEAHDPDYGAKLRVESTRESSLAAAGRVLGVALVSGCVAGGLAFTSGQEGWLLIGIFFGAVLTLATIVYQDARNRPVEVALYERALVVTRDYDQVALTQVQSVTRVWRGVRVRTPYRDAFDLRGLSDAFVAEAERVLVTERLGRPV